MAGAADSPDARAALESLCRNYWRPLYIYARRRGHTHQDAEDVIQAFFHRLLEKEALAHASRHRGRFRSFLLASLQNFMANERDRLGTLKRGGAHAHFSLDEADGEKLVLEAEAPDKSAEEQYDRAWARTIFHQAMIRLEDEFRGDGKQSQFCALAPFISRPPEAGEYQRVAEKLAIRPGLMPTVVSRLRQRFRALVRLGIAETVASPAEIDAELRYLVELMTQ